jgi:hypothetical protein
VTTTIARTAVRAICLASSLAFASTAQASITIYNANLSGSNESPPNASPGTGLAVVTIDDGANTMRVQVTFSGLTGTTTASHIHAPTPSPFSGTAGVATTTPTFAGFPLGVTSGTYDSTLDLLLSSSYNPAYITANGGTPASAETALLSAISSGRAYLNIHTSTFGGGEIRGFLVAVVPEPASWAMMLLGFGAIGVVARRRRSLFAAA